MRIDSDHVHTDLSIVTLYYKDVNAASLISSLALTYDCVQRNKQNWDLRIA